jgi:hypothetical protein
MVFCVLQNAYFQDTEREVTIKGMLCRDDIRKDPSFRAQFHTMCANIGVDPLASNKGLWAQVLGFGDFYYELGVQIVEACMATRSMNGGLMDMQSLLRYVAVCALLIRCPVHAREHHCAACWNTNSTETQVSMRESPALGQLQGLGPWRLTVAGSW